jgi:hypothetical protein
MVVRVRQLATWARGIKPRPHTNQRSSQSRPALKLVQQAGMGIEEAIKHLHNQFRVSALHRGRQPGGCAIRQHNAVLHKNRLTAFIKGRGFRRLIGLAKIARRAAHRVDSEQRGGAGHAHRRVALGDAALESIPAGDSRPRQ